MPYHLATAPYSIITDLPTDDSNGNRTRVTAVKGRCLNRLTMEPDERLHVALTNDIIPYLQAFDKGIFKEICIGNLHRRPRGRHNAKAVPPLLAFIIFHHFEKVPSVFSRQDRHSPHILWNPAHQPAVRHDNVRLCIGVNFLDPIRPVLWKRNLQCSVVHPVKAVEYSQ